MKDFEKHFWDRVDRSGGLDACWPWMGHRMPAGYGQVWFCGKTRQATHVACELVGKELPAGLFWLHDCDNPPCCNPAHLFAGTNKDNRQDCKRKERTPVGDRHGTHTHPESRLTGEKNHKAKLTWRSVRRMRHMYGAGVAKAELARKFGVTHQNVSMVVGNKYWKEL